MPSEWARQNRPTGIRRCHTCWNLTQVCRCMQQAIDDIPFVPATADRRPDTALSADLFRALLDQTADDLRQRPYRPNPPLFRHFLTVEELERAIDEASGSGFWPHMLDGDD